MKSYDELPIISKDFGGAVSITKTPTQEQIEHIAKVIFCTNSDKPVSEMVYKGISDYWDRCLNKNTRIRYKAKAKIAIAEWEKIRNQ